MPDLWNGVPSGSVGSSTTWTRNNATPSPSYIWYNYVDWIISNYASGTSTLAGLSDVNIPAPTNAQVLTYNSGTGKWVAGTPALSGLSDVTITSPANGQSLTYDSGTGKWVNSSTGSGFVTFNGVETLTNKTIGVTNVVQGYDLAAPAGVAKSFRIVRGDDTSKSIIFQLSNLTSAANPFGVVQFPACPAQVMQVLIADATQTVSNKFIDGGAGNTLQNFGASIISSGFFGVARGGTGMTTVGSAGTVLTSNGGGLYYSSIIPNVSANLTGGTSVSPTPLVTGYNISKVSNSTNEYILPTGSSGSECLLANKTSPGGGNIIQAPSGGTIDGALSIPLATLTSVKMVCTASSGLIWESVMYGTL